MNRLRLPESVSATLSFAIILGACGQDARGPTSPPTPPPPPERVVKLSPLFGADIVEIFERRGCTMSTCHGGGAGGLALNDTATSYNNLVNVVSGCNGLIRVIPGDAVNSYLLSKLDGTQACGVQMPRGDVPLDSIDFNNIRNWIIENALNN